MAAIHVPYDGEFFQSVLQNWLWEVPGSLKLVNVMLLQQDTCHKALYIISHYCAMYVHCFCTVTSSVRSRV